MGMKLGIFIAAPREAVFEAFTDLDRWEEAVEGIVRLEKLTDGPVGDGTRFRETRVMFKKEHTEEMWFDGVDPPEGYSIKGESCGSTFDSRFTFSEKHGGTQVDMEMTWKAQTFLAKLMAPVGMLMSGAMKKAMLKDFADVKTYVEARHGAPDEAGVA